MSGEHVGWAENSAVERALSWEQKQSENERELTKTNTKRLLEWRERKVVIGRQLGSVVGGKSAVTNIIKLKIVDEKNICGKIRRVKLKILSNLTDCSRGIIKLIKKEVTQNWGQQHERMYENIDK